MNKPKSVTLDDVARHAGVSYQTVSRVLNQAEQVAEKTRRKVEAAMSELNYVPNRVAQQLAGKQSFTLGLASTDLALHAPSQGASAIKSRAHQLGYHVVISMVEDLQLQSCRAAVNELIAQRVDGILINVPLETEDAQAITQYCADLPVLFLDVDPQACLFSTVFDANEGAKLGVEHLLALGHRQIALLSGPQASVSARLRYQGWLHELAAHQLTPLRVMEGDWSAASGYQCALTMLNQPQLPTAILVANDQMALGVLRAAHASGVAVPQQLSVVGYDDTQDSAYFQPPLTTIRQDFQLSGRESVNRLVQLLQKNQSSFADSLLLNTTLVQRQTTAVPGETLPSAQLLAQELIRIARQLQQQ
ncbi:MAG: LacI family DNA-binding transcriptional regulator [Rouxiella aceris]|uniref:LacI family DNA-binding transcriptional regulator n=1 Tax=Rouxiella aceris TaxID=2703884 RepID=UPI00284F56AC|nr:LacI family DNA-binding transcriptional regulator [Rouxiella aceris]MDR3432974.1 LacI family DNA-binding transcriptional regulator [Rouxiella aceris]